MVNSSKRALFNELEPPRHLLRMTLVRVVRARRRSMLFRATGLGLVVLGSGTLLVPLVLHTINQFNASGFVDYFSLLFSDSSIVLAHWQELALSLVESVPSIALLLLVSCLSAFVWSLRGTLRSVKAAGMSLQVS